MTTLPRHRPERLTFTPENAHPTHVHLYDRDKDALPLVLSAELQQFIFENSTIKALRLCSDRNPCQRRFCPWCSRRVAARTRYALQPTALQHEQALELTFTTISAPTLSQAWGNLASVRSRFLAHGWLTHRCLGWIRETEITHSPAGWHVHDHVLVFAETIATLRVLRIDAPTRWLESARHVGIMAAPIGQHAAMHDRVHDRVRYVTKSQMRSSGSTRTGGRTLGAILAGYKAGLVDDVALWNELETFFGAGTKRRWKSTGGVFRGLSARDHSKRHDDG